MTIPVKRNSFQNPMFGKLSSVQEKYAAGEKTSTLPDPVPPGPDPHGGVIVITPVPYPDPVPPINYNWPGPIPVYRETTPCVPGSYYITQQLSDILDY